MPLTLHGIAGSRAIRCLWMLEELGVPYTHVPVDFRGQTRTAEFLALNPNGHIPVLQDGELVVWESLAINLYLARRCGGPLAPVGHEEDAACLMWSFWAANEIERECVAILLHRQALPEDRRKPEAARQAEGRLREPLAVLEKHLARQSCLAASRFTVADLNVASILAWARPATALIAAFPAVSAWLGKALARPSWASANAR
jgi:glutathione S-transferase